MLRWATNATLDVSNVFFFKRRGDGQIIILEYGVNCYMLWKHKVFKLISVIIDWTLMEKMSYIFLIAKKRWKVSYNEQTETKCMAKKASNLMQHECTFSMIRFPTFFALCSRASIQIPLVELNDNNVAKQLCMIWNDGIFLYCLHPASWSFDLNNSTAVRILESNWLPMTQCVPSK